jgi:DNA-binding SARP family transcriptional activator
MTHTPFPDECSLDDCYALERAGKIGRAVRQAQAALAAARADGRAEAQAAALACLAYMHNRLGHREQAQGLASEALSLAAPLSETRARALRTLGDCAHEQGDLAGAEQHYFQAIDQARQLDLIYILHRCLHSLSACVYLPRGQFELAYAADAESLALAEREGFDEELWLPLLTMSWARCLAGDREAALALADRMRAHAPPDSLAEGYHCCLRGDLALGDDDPEAALEWYGRARGMAERVGEPGLHVELRLGLSRCDLLLGEPASAYEWADDALQMAQRGEGQDLQGSALLERGRAAWQLGHLAAAEGDIEAAIRLFAAMSARYDLARAHLLLAALLYQQHRPEAESAWLRAASEVAGGGYGFLLERERALALPLLSVFLGSPAAEVAAASRRLRVQLERTPPAPLHITTLGVFAVRQGRLALGENGWQRRAGELFRLLLISPGTSLAREQVMAALWPNSPPGAVTDLFHRATSVLRRALEPDLPEKFLSRYLDVGQGSVTLRLPPGAWVDHEAFQGHVQAREWAAALALYRGDLYPTDLYADWATPLRERLRQQALHAALSLAREQASLGDSQGTLAASRRALEIEPWQEEATLLAMQACAHLHDRLAAIRLYRRLAASLAEELGIEPQAELQRFYRSLL